MKTRLLKYGLFVMLCCGLFSALTPLDETPGTVELLVRRRLPPQYLTVVDTVVNHVEDTFGVLKPFVDKLAGLRAGDDRVVSILHIGDSHLQAGFLTGPLREWFQEDFGNAGRGLVAPLKLIGTNQPQDYTILSPNRWTGFRCISPDSRCPVGITAMAAATGENRPEFTIRCPDAFTQVRAFHHSRAPLLHAPDSLWSGIACTEENTELSTLIVLDRPVREVTLQAPVVDTAYNVPVFYGFSLENGRPGVLYHMSGINGTAFEHLNRSEEIIRQSPLLAPDLIIVSLGTNDSFGNRYDPELLYGQISAFLRKLKEVNPGVPILLTTPMECYMYRRVKGRTRQVPNEQVARTAQQIRRAALEYKTALWDFYAAAGGEGANSRWKEHDLTARDRVHLSEAGYGLQAALFYDAFTDYCRTAAISR